MKTIIQKLLKFTIARKLHQICLRNFDDQKMINSYNLDTNHFYVKNCVKWSQFYHNNLSSGSRKKSQSSVDSMSSFSSTPSTPTSPIDYEIQIATEKDNDVILKFLQTFFYKDEPLNFYLQLINEKNPRCFDLERFSLKNLNNGLNLKAVHNGEVIGVCLNDILERGWTEKEDSFKCDDKKFGKIVDLLDYVAKASDPFKKYPGSDKAMTVKIISVNGAYRGKGIAKELMAKTRDLAKENGCGFMSVDCTSHFTACALKNLGFELHYSLKYSDYKVNGEVVFKPAAPHTAVTVYTQKIV